MGEKEQDYINKMREVIRERYGEGEAQFDADFLSKYELKKHKGKITNELKEFFECILEDEKDLKETYEELGFYVPFVSFCRVSKKFPILTKDFEAEHGSLKTLFHWYLLDLTFIGAETENQSDIKKIKPKILLVYFTPEHDIQSIIEIPMIGKNPLGNIIDYTDTYADYLMTKGTKCKN